MRPADGSVLAAGPRFGRGGVTNRRVALRCGSPGVLARGWTGEVWASGPQRGEDADGVEGVDDLVGPGPVVGEAEVASAGAVGQAGGDVQEPVPQRFRLAGLQGGGQG